MTLVKSHAKEWSFTFTVYHKQNLTENGKKDLKLQDT